MKDMLITKEEIIAAAVELIRQHIVRFIRRTSAV